MAKTYWKNRSEWVCARHLPSISIPANEGQCFFSGCVSVRPKNRPSVEEAQIEEQVNLPVKKEDVKIVEEKKVEVTVETQEIDKEKLCAWRDCDKGPNEGPAIRKSRSKYCSRDCSNKNARFRHKLRKK